MVGDYLLSTSKSFEAQPGELPGPTRLGPFRRHTGLFWRVALLKLHPAPGFDPKVPQQDHRYDGRPVAR